MFDLISIGDCVIDTIIPLQNALLFNKDGETYIGLEYGAKVPVDEGVSMVGGNAANNAVGSARLGLKTAIYTNVGNRDDDEADNRIMSRFRKEKVDTRYIVETSKFPSNHNIVLQFNGERTILINHQPWDFQLPDLDRSRWVYLTSLSPSYIDSNVIEQLIAYLERLGCKLAYQPGTFQLKQGLKKQVRLLNLTDFFVVNLEEAKHFLGHETSKSLPIKNILKSLSDLGPKQVVVTDGGEGSYGYDGEKFWKIKSFPSKLLEITGAGDAYATGAVAGLLHGEVLSEAMRWGSCNSASVVEFIGPQAGLLTLHQIQERLKTYRSIQPEEI